MKYLNYDIFRKRTKKVLYCSQMATKKHLDRPIYPSQSNCRSLAQYPDRSNAELVSIKNKKVDICHIIIC